ncbi:uncharacterized protein LOC101459192 [Ceratitis capitata]|uniref:uncharacterized protein LOC101459192 n=1 Tax=Ceratitis capitata TaxID=7213 RepID=UPI00032A201B|nr:uncharacterized protein LOC101459192 [Ceratitis capitata]
MPESDVTKMTEADLTRELKLRWLATTGNKTELHDGDISLEDSAISNEDALLDEDAVLADEAESPIAADENELLKSPIRTPKAPESTSIALDASKISANAKKIILKRKLDDENKTSTEDFASATTTKENIEPPKEKILKMSERNPITVSDITIKKVSNTKANSTDSSGAASGKEVATLTQTERLELRAKKFGIDSNSTKKTTTPTTKPARNKKLIIEPIVNDAKQIELLKKRAERFGCVLSSKMAKIDAAEKLLKRKERFGARNGAAITASATPGTANTNYVWAEKARARLERFKSTQTSLAAEKKVITSASSSTENNELSKESAPQATVAGK